MRSEAGPEEQRSYRRAGFAVMPGFLDAAEVAAWRQALNDALEARSDEPHPAAPLATTRPSAVPIRQEVWPQRYRFTQRMNLWQSSPAMSALLLDERLGRVACQLAGIDGVRLWYDQSFVKAPWAAPTPIHQDNPYWSFTSADAISIWVALDDVEIANGALFYLPGTHLVHEWQQAPGAGFADIFDVHPQWATLEPVFCPVQAGDALWHNGLTAHGAAANLSPVARRAVNCAFMPCGARFNGIRNVLPADAFARYRPGDELADDALNPVIYSHAELPGWR